MEIFGGFMVMMGVLGFLLAVLWFILPFVVFAMKGKLDRSYELLEGMERRLAVIEEELRTLRAARPAPGGQPSEPDTQESPLSPPSAAE